MITRKSISQMFSVLFVLLFMLTQVGPTYAISSGTISGTIKDSIGNAVTTSSIQVRAVNKSDGSEVAVTFSNVADGTYQFTGLPLNINLAVIASDEFPDVDGYVGQYYNNVDILEWAETITLTGGAPDQVGVDFNLRDGSGGVTLDHLTFNTRVGRLLNDVNIRKAIAYGTNRLQLLYNAFLPNGNLGIIMHSMVAPGLWYQASQSDLTIYSYDSLTAKSTLAAAGWVDSNADGIRDNGIVGPNHVELALDFVTTTAAQRTASANLFKTQMQEIGILINIATYSGSDFFSGDPVLSPLASGDFDIAEFAWILQDYDTLLPFYNIGDPQNYGGYSNTTLETYFNAARDAKVTGDQSTFQAKSLLWQQLISQDLPVLPLFTRNGIIPANVPVGTNVHAVSGNANATFAHVTGEGWFGITAGKYNPNDLPVGYKQGDPNVYEVGSNAVFDTTQVCITYDASTMSMANEYFLKMFHFVDGTWTDVTTPGTLNIATNQICGDFTSFSVVALMYDDSGGGSISGTVMNSSDVPITGAAMTVSAELPEGVLAQASTNPADGTYMISGLPLGLNIKLNAFDNNFPLIYGKEYYPETAFLSVATVFNLSVGTPGYSGINFTLPQAQPGPNSIEHLTFNVRPGRFLNDPLIRRAIAYGTDRERMLKAFLGGNEYGVVLNSLIAPGYWSQPAYSQVSVYPYNPAQAISILDAAGITDHNSNGIRDIGGNDIILDFKTTFAASRIAASAIFVENMAAIGIQVNVTNVTGTDFFSSDPAISPLAAGNFDIAEFAWGASEQSVDDAYPMSVYQTGNFQNHGGYSNATADAEYNAAFVATNRASMLPHVLAYYAATTNDMPSLPLFTRETVAPVDTLSGTSVLADLSSNGVTVIYQNATSSGRTAALTSVINPGDLPTNNGMLALYEIGSSVTMSANTGATVCVHYDDTGLTSMQENNLQLYHLTMNGARSWRKIFTSRDTTANHICGFTTGFSTFAVLLPINVETYIGGVLRGSYYLTTGESTRQNYVGVDSGPVKVMSTNGTPIISAIREAWAVNGVTTSFFQMMGLPQEQLSDTYVFPGYNNVTLNEQLRISNVDSVPSTVTVTIGGVLRGTYPLAAGEAVRINYAGLDSGPVIVQGTTGVKIISAIREAWAVGGVTRSFVQLMGLPKQQLSDKYVFPGYNNVTLNEQLRIGNVDSVASTVTVTIGGVLRGTYILQPNEAVRVNYAGVDSGPVIVQGTAGVKIISAIREAWAVNGVTTSFAQLMGLPSGQLSNKYVFPGYNNVTLNDQLRIGNVDSVQTTVTVTIGGVLRGSYTLQPNEAVRVNYAGLDSGPVVVEGSAGVKIISAVREAWAVNGVTTSFTQLMGLPFEQLSSTFWFPAYNNVTLNEQLRIAVP